MNKAIGRLEGVKFGRLIVVSYSHTGKNRSSHWECVCDCGGVKIVGRNALISGKTKSCGCLRKESTSRTATRHGLSQSPTYKIWKGMRVRATNGNISNAHRYTGRGITCCARWSLFEHFLEDMGERPEGLVLDRINNDEGYSKENCRWTTVLQNNNNTSKNRFLEHGGERKTVNEWATSVGMGNRTLRSRLNQLNFSIERALTEPVNTYRGGAITI